MSPNLHEYFRSVLEIDAYKQHHAQKEVQNTDTSIVSGYNKWESWE